jgi:hypothetical protein
MDARAHSRAFVSGYFGDRLRAGFIVLGVRLMLVVTLDSDPAAGDPWAYHGLQERRVRLDAAKAKDR